MSITVEQAQKISAALEKLRHEIEVAFERAEEEIRSITVE